MNKNKKRYEQEHVLKEKQNGKKQDEIKDRTQEQEQKLEKQTCGKQEDGPHHKRVGRNHEGDVCRYNSKWPGETSRDEHGMRGDSVDYQSYYRRRVKSLPLVANPVHRRPPTYPAPAYVSNPLNYTPIFTATPDRKRHIYLVPGISQLSL